MDIQESFTLAKNWFLTSSIQTLNNLKGPSFFGSFSSWFDLESKTYPFVYSEATGYGIMTLLFLNHLKPDDVLIQRAEFAAQWLHERTECRGGGYQCVVSHVDNSFKYKKDEAYTFDAGIILNSFVNLYRATQKEKYLEASNEILKWLHKMTDKKGQVYAVYDIQRKMNINSDKTWSTEPGPFLAKNAIGLLNLYDVTKNKEAKKMAGHLCDLALERQEGCGRFVCHSSGHTNIHPHSYAAEGLLCAGIYLGNETYIQSALRATEWVLKNQREDGAVPRLFLKEPNYHQRSDGMAQTIRLATLLKKKGYLGEKYDEDVNKLMGLLLTFQYEDKTLNQQGGFLFGFSSQGESVRNVNSWCTMFALQALNWHGRESIPDDEVVHLFI